MKKAILIIILFCSASAILKAQQKPKADTATLRIPVSNLKQLYNLLTFYSQNIATSRAKSVDVEDSKDILKSVAPFLTALEADTTRKVQVIILPKHPAANP